MWILIGCYLLATSVGSVMMTALIKYMDPYYGFSGGACCGVDMTPIFYGISLFLGPIVWPLIMCQLLMQSMHTLTKKIKHFNTPKRLKK